MRIIISRLLIVWWMAPLLYLVGITFVYLLEGDFKDKHEFGVELIKKTWNGNL